MEKSKFFLALIIFSSCDLGVESERPSSNISFDTALFIQADMMVDAVVPQQESVLYYTFQLEKTAVVQIDVLNPKSDPSDWAVEFFDSERILKRGFQNVIPFRNFAYEILLFPGQYFFAVKGLTPAGSGSTQVRFAVDETDSLELNNLESQATIVEIDKVYRASFRPVGDVDYYLVEAPDTLVIDMTYDNTLDLTIYLPPPFERHPPSVTMDSRVVERTRSWSFSNFPGPMLIRASAHENAEIRPTYYSIVFRDGGTR